LIYWDLELFNISISVDTFLEVTLDTGSTPVVSTILKGERMSKDDKRKELSQIYFEETGKKAMGPTCYSHEYVKWLEVSLTGLFDEFDLLNSTYK